MGGLGIIERIRIYSLKPYILGKKLKRCVTLKSVEHNGSELIAGPYNASHPYSSAAIWDI